MTPDKALRDMFADITLAVRDPRLYLAKQIANGFTVADAWETWWQALATPAAPAAFNRYVKTLEPENRFQFSLALAHLAQTEAPDVLPDLGALPEVYQASTKAVRQHLEAASPAASFSKIAVNLDVFRGLPDLSAFCANHLQQRLPQLARAERPAAEQLIIALRPILLQ